MLDLFKSKFSEALKDINLQLNDKKIEKFYKFYVNLIETNKFMNLTAITEINEVIYKHFIDSLSIIKALPDICEKKYKIIDVGTGAGFPGIPLAIAFDNIDIVLLDSLNKRIKFIEENAKLLELKNIKAIHGRAEDFANNKDYREKFDLAVSRAVANLSTLSEYCIPFVSLDGLFVAYKSENIEEELNKSKKAFHLLCAKLKYIEKFNLNFDNSGRSIVLIEKKETTSKKYPRKAGIPTKEPL